MSLKQVQSFARTLVIRFDADGCFVIKACEVKANVDTLPNTYICKKIVFLDLIFFHRNLELFNAASLGKETYCHPEIYRMKGPDFL